MKKKFVSFAMAMVMVLGLAACGEKKAETPAQTPAETPAEAAGSTFKLGTIGP